METTTAEGAAMMTLDELNATTTTTSTWSTYTVRDTWAVGVNGQQTAWRGHSGSKLHLLRVGTIIADTNPTPGWVEYNGQRSRVLTVGGNAHVYGACAANGQRTGDVVKGRDLADITCQRCLQRLERILANVEAERQAAAAIADALKAALNLTAAAYLPDQAELDAELVDVVADTVLDGTITPGVTEAGEAVLFLTVTTNAGTVRLMLTAEQGRRLGGNLVDAARDAEAAR